MVEVIKKAVSDEKQFTAYDLYRSKKEEKLDLEKLFGEDIYSESFLAGKKKKESTDNFKLWRLIIVLLILLVFVNTGILFYFFR